MEDDRSVGLQDDSLSVEVTTHCNSSCSHCFVRARGSSGDSLSPGLVKDAVREAYELGYRRLHITGGEPLLWGGLPGVLDCALGMGYETVFLNTNGQLLNDAVCRELASYNSLTLSVSIQGPRALHDSFRGKGSYDLALQGVKNALNEGLRVHIFAVLGRSLLADLQTFADGLFAAFPDIARLTFIQIIRVPEDVFDLSQELLSPDDFITFVRKASLLSLYGMRVSVLNNPLAIVAAKVLRMPWLPLSPPLYRSGSVLIAADSRVTLAHSTTHHLGAYEPGALRKIIESDEYRHAVSGNRSTCGDCQYSTLCSADGMTSPSEWYRDMSPEIPYCVRVLSRASAYG